MTGQYAAFGAQLKNGAEQAVADINKAGGVLGQQLQLNIGDDACDPRQAVSVANQFASQGDKLVVGHFCSGSSIPASKVYGEEGHPADHPGLHKSRISPTRAAGTRSACAGVTISRGMVAGDYIAAHLQGPTRSRC